MKPPAQPCICASLSGMPHSPPSHTVSRGSGVPYCSLAKHGRREPRTPHLTSTYNSLIHWPGELEQRPPSLHLSFPISNRSMIKKKKKRASKGSACQIHIDNKCLRWARSGSPGLCHSAAEMVRCPPGTGGRITITPTPFTTHCSGCRLIRTCTKTYKTNDRSQKTGQSVHITGIVFACS